MQATLALSGPAHIEQWGLAMAYLRKRSQHLGPLIYTADGLGRRARVVCGNVLEDILEPTLSFCSPSYFCHERMRRAIS